jgi:glycerophosphoryl diester phosphodiesterase
MFNPLKLGFTMHRGLSSEAPENTVPAFTLAGQGGAWGIETDVQESSDGVFYVFHDSTVDRMTDGTGTLTSMTSAQIDALTIDSGSHIEEYDDLKVPRLSEYLAICKKYGCVPVIELKGITHYNNFIDEVKSYGLEFASIFIAASLPPINAIRSQGCKTLCAWIRPTNYDYDDALEDVLAIENCTLDLEVPDSHLTHSAVEKFHEYNLPVMVYVCDSILNAESLANIGVDNITSNSIIKFL